MEKKLIELAATQGIWTILSITLIFYILKNQEKRDIRQEEREGNYQNIIINLTKKFNLIEEIKEDVSEIKNFVFNKEV